MQAQKVSQEAKITVTATQYQEKVRRIFDEYAEIYNEVAYGKEWSEKNEELASFFDNLLQEKIGRADRKSVNILDVGCGTGVPAIGLSKRGYRVHGIDISNNMIRVATDNSVGAKNLEFSRMNWMDLCPEVFKVKFDVVILKGAAIDLSETEEDAISLLDHIYPVMKDGAFLYLTLRNWESVEARVRKDPIEFATERPIEKNGKIFTVIYRYDWKLENQQEKLYADFIFSTLDTKAGTNNICKAYHEKIRTLKVTEQMLSDFVRKSAFGHSSMERISVAGERLMGNLHLPYILRK